MKFILFHGSFGNPQENWFPELRTTLETLGQDVIAPQFPTDDWDTMLANGPSVPLRNQTLDQWLTTFENNVLPMIQNDDKLTFVGHSLGPLFILHVVEKFHLTLDCAIFVSPFLDMLDRWEFNHANGSFYKTTFDFETLKSYIPVSYVLYSDNDPYVSAHRARQFATSLSSSTILLVNAGHINADAGITNLPIVTDLCVSRLPWQQYNKSKSTK